MWTIGEGAGVYIDRSPLVVGQPVVDDGARVRSVVVGINRNDEVVLLAANLRAPGTADAAVCRLLKIGGQVGLLVQRRTDSPAVAGLRRMGNGRSVHNAWLRLQVSATGDASLDPSPPYKLPVEIRLPHGSLKPFNCFQA